MTEAQLEAYGDAVDPEKLHPYMWINKPHYFSAGLSFYNFPYAFGLLFAKGIYAQYTEQGAAFVPKVNELLRKTGQMSVEEVADLIGIDVKDEAFWHASLNVIESEIDQFLALTE
jgi:oligoendopeptidase F